MNEEYTIIEDGRKFIVIDQRGDLMFDSYWHQECRDWIENQRDEDCEDDDDY